MSTELKKSIVRMAWISREIAMGRSGQLCITLIFLIFLCGTIYKLDDRCFINFKISVFFHAFKIKNTWKLFPIYCLFFPDFSGEIYQKTTICMTTTKRLLLKIRSFDWFLLKSYRSQMRDEKVTVTSRCRTQPTVKINFIPISAYLRLQYIKIIVFRVSSTYFLILKLFLLFSSSNR